MKEWSMCEVICHSLLATSGAREQWQQEVHCHRFTRADERGGVGACQEVKICIECSR